MQAALLSDGVRLHLQAGPIDLIVLADAQVRAACYRAACARFDGLLEDLVSELPELRREGGRPQGRVARRMAAAVAPFAPAFITPMAAVAGAVAEDILEAMVAVAPEARLWVNNGGDVAWQIPDGEMRLAMAGGIVGVPATAPWHGCATSGRGGRSHSLGIADAVTVLAPRAAMADAAATMIANRVDLPGHPAIARTPARELSPDSDLGARLVTTDVGPLSRQEVLAALAPAVAYAEELRNRGLIGAAHLILNGETRQVGASSDITMELEHG